MSDTLMASEMTMRDSFAAASIPAMWAEYQRMSGDEARKRIREFDGDLGNMIATMSYAFADKMLTHRETPSDWKLGTFKV
jgi:hypothetical protein